MSGDMQVKRGTKIDETDPALKGQKFGLLISLAPADEVEGQSYTGLTQCPYCGNVGWTRGLDEQYYVNVYCGRCGHMFRA